MTLSNNILIAITANSVILLLVSWFFGAYIIGKLQKEKEALLNENGGNTDEAIDNTDLSHLIMQMKQEILEKEAVIEALMQDVSDEQTQSMIEALTQDLNSSKQALEQMEQELASGQGLSARIAYLEKAERRLREENKNMRTTGLQLAEKLEVRNEQINHLKNTNAKLKETIKKLTNASKEQLEVIKSLQAQVERAEELENYQRGLISDLETQLQQAKSVDADQRDDEKIKTMEQELEKLEDKLKRTMIEKDFIESHILELDDSIEKAKETEEALKRAQEEIAALEQQFPEYSPATPIEAETETEAEPEATQSMSDFDMDDMEEISSDNMLFGPLQNYWATLGMPELILSADDSNPLPKRGEWASVTIGNNEYQLLINISTTLAQKLSSAIVKETSENPAQDCLGQLGKVMAQPLADDMVNNAVSTAQLIDQSAVEDHINRYETITEMLAITEDSQIYAVLTNLASED